jgi:mono/diheme cytochrome c family protein
MKTLLAVVGTLAAAGLSVVAPAEPGAQADERKVREFFNAYCTNCHGPDEAKKELRLDNLPATFTDRSVRDRWGQIHDRIRQGEMPPKTKTQPKPEEVKSVLAWIASKVDGAESEKRAKDGRTVLRRLNRVEYQNTMRDLLGVGDLDLKSLLPPDASADGFDNVGEALHSSSFLMERYLDAADMALNAAIANGARPGGFQRRFDLRKDAGLKLKGDVYRAVDDGVAIFCSWENANVQVTLWGFRSSMPGRYRFRLSGYGFQSGGRPFTFHLKDGSFIDTGDNRNMVYFDVPENKPTVVEWIERLEPNRTLRLAVDPGGSQREVHREVTKAGVDNYKGPGLVVQWIEIEGPLMESWPPQGHKMLFGDMPQGPDPAQGGRVEVISKDPKADAKRILLDFARRAFRRAVTEADVRPFVARVESKMAEGHSFERAMRAGLKAVLISPEFLFLRERPGKLDDFALASRLSYFLWSSMPDDELLALAEKNELAKPDALRAQVERMLKDPKAKAFTDNFVGQWLNLRAIDDTEPDPTLYPEYTDDLKGSMVREPYLYFDEILREDLPLTRFVSSDFSILNGPLAKLYEIPGVEGREFRKVSLPADSHRGGVLTMSAVLKVTANGTNTSPVIRGAWVLERILGTPPPRPPVDVEAVEPDIRGATTIRQQLAKHRSRPECASCHQRIDPPGFALESFDVIGGWRENYRSVGKGEPVSIPGMRIHYKKGPAVDPADHLLDGRKFKNIDEYKDLLLRNPDALARALAEKVLTYATGGAPSRTDGPEIDALVRGAREKKYGFRSLIHGIVQSRLFQSK